MDWICSACETLGTLGQETTEDWSRSGETYRVLEEAKEKSPRWDASVSAQDSSRSLSENAFTQGNDETQGNHCRERRDLLGAWCAA